MKYAIVDIRVSELLTKQVSCVPWEVPILEALHGGNVRLVGEEEVDRVPPASPQDEYLRLSNRYRGNKDDENTIVAQVYGTQQGGIANLREAMMDAGIEFEDAQLRRDVPKVRSSRMETGVRKRGIEGAVSRAGTPNRVQVKPTPGAPSIARPAPRPTPRPTPAPGPLEAKKAAARDARARFQNPPPARSPVTRPR